SHVVETGDPIVVKPDGGVDAGPPDAGPPDAGDAGPSDAGPTAIFGTPGPWPVANVTYGFADGIQEAPVVGVSTDEPIQTTDGEWFDVYRHTGKLDRVRIKTDSSGNPVLDKSGNIVLDVARFDMVSGNSPQFWHNRTVFRMVYDHFVHKHELYAGTEHGVVK